MIKLYDGPYELIRTSALHPIHSERKEEIPRNIRRLFFPILPTKGSQLYTFTKNQDNKISYCRLYRKHRVRFM